MKQGTLIMRIIMLVLFGGAIAYFGIYLWNAMTPDVTTTSLYTYTAEELVESEGYFFRDETLLTGGAELAEVLCDEGEKVSAGEEIARIYYSSAGYELQQELDEAEATLESLQYILSRMNESADSMALDDDIIDAIVGLRYAASTGDLSDLDDDANELRSLIFRRDYTYNGTDSLTAEIAEAEALVESLTAQASSAYTLVTAPSAGLFSAAVDGYEGVLTLDALEGLTPSRLETLADSQGSVSSNVLGKVITNTTWYFSCDLTEEQASDLYNGATVRLRFDSSDRIYTASVSRISDPEDGLVNVTICSTDYAALLTDLREEGISIITSSATGFRVPKQAVRVNSDATVADVGALGVYRVAGSQAEWVSIEILWEEDDYYLITEAADESSLLREGNTIIVKGDDLYDGKVVEY